MTNENLAMVGIGILAILIAKYSAKWHRNFYQRRLSEKDQQRSNKWFDIFEIFHKWLFILVGVLIMAINLYKFFV